MITVHHLKQSRSHRILWLLEELQVPYHLKIYERDPKAKTAPPELLKIHPLGKSPVVTDGDRVIAESGAILEYILDHYGKGQLKPADKKSQEFLDYQYFMHYAEGTLMPQLVLSLIFHMIPKQPMPFFVKPIMKEISRNVHRVFIDPQIHMNLKFLEAKIKNKKWFTGDDFSVADIQLGFAIYSAHSLQREKFQYPRLSKFLAEIQARPAYQEALQKGGPIDLT